jgi:hypothetical protein
MRKIVLPSLFDQRDGLTDVMVEYVISYAVRPNPNNMHHPHPSQVSDTFACVFWVLRSRQGVLQIAVAQKQVHERGMVACNVEPAQNARVRYQQTSLTWISLPSLSLHHH